MLEDLGSDAERNSVRDVDQMSMRDEGDEDFRGLIVVLHLKVFFNDPEVLSVNFKPLISFVKLVKSPLDVVLKVSGEVTHTVLGQEDPVCDVVEQPTDESDLLEGQEWILALLHFPLELLVVDHNKPSRDDKAEDIDHLLVPIDHLDHLVVLRDVLVLEVLNLEGVAEVFVKNVENVGPIDDLGLNLSTLLDV